MPVILKINEAEIFESLRKGHEEGFSLIFKEWYKPVYHFAFSLLKNTQDAEDITDDCFIKMWERRSKFSSLISCKSFLFTCVRNSSLDKLRKRKTKLKAEKGFEYLIANTNDILYFNDNNADPFSKLQDALKELPPKHRKIFDMVYNEGKSALEVAATLNLSVQTVKNQKQKGFEILRKILIPFFPK